MENSPLGKYTHLFMICACDLKLYYVNLNKLVSHLACIFVFFSLFNVQQVRAHPQITNPSSTRRKPIKAPIAVSVAVCDSCPSSSVVFVGLTFPASIFVFEAVEDYRRL